MASRVSDTRFLRPTLLSKWRGLRGLEGPDRDGEALADEGPVGPRAPRALGRERGQGVDLCAQRESKHRTSRNFKGFQSFAKFYTVSILF